MSVDTQLTLNILGCLCELLTTGEVIIIINERISIYKFSVRWEEFCRRKIGWVQPVCSCITGCALFDSLDSCVEDLNCQDVLASDNFFW